MPDIPDPNWIRHFVGREAELDLLRARLFAAAPSLAGRSDGRATPSVVVLLGDSGLGKSRLVQEFYRRLACSPGQGGCDPSDYWPDAFGNPDTSAKSVNPSFEPGQTVGKHPPFIWWGVRWPEPAGGGVSSSVQLTAPTYLDLLEVHRDARRRQVEKLLGLAARGAKLATNSLIPGLDDVPILKQVQEAIQSGSDVRDLMRAAHDGSEAVQEWLGRQDASRAIVRRSRSALGIVRKNLLRILDPAGIGALRDARTPLVLWLDDAQWMTPDEAACLHGLLVDAGRASLPLFVVATHWEADWRRDESTSTSSSAASTSEPTNLHQVLQSIRLGLNAGRAERERSVVTEEVFLAAPGRRVLDLGTCVDRALPGLQARQREQVLRLAGGNPLLLRLIVDELHRYPDRFIDRSLASPLTAEAEADLSSIAVAEARRTFVGRRIRDLGVDVRRVLEMGSLQGSEFLREVTCEVAVERGIAREEAVAALADASRIHAILEEGSSTMAFRQDIYRDVLQGSLGEQERRGIEAAIRNVLVRRSSASRAVAPDERALFNELAVRFLAAPSGEVDWGATETALWISALVENLEALDRNGLDIQALAKARDIVAIDKRSIGGIPLAILGAERGAFVLRVLARYGTESESLSFGQRLLSHVGGLGPGPRDAATVGLLMQVAELRGAIAEQALYAAALRGAQAALAEGDPLSARIALDSAPVSARGPEHGMLTHEASRRGRVVRPNTGGNPYRLRDLPGSGCVALVFDGDFEVVDRSLGTVARFPLGCLGAKCPAIQLSVASSERSGVYMVAVGSTSYPDAELPPQVHMHELRMLDGTCEFIHLWSRDSTFRGYAAFLSADRVASPTPHGGVAIMDARTGAVLREIAPPPEGGSAQSIIALDESTLAVELAGETVELSLADGTWRRGIHFHSIRVNTMRRSRDGRLLGIGGGRQAVVIDREAGTVTALGGIEGDAWDIEFSPDGRQVAVVAGDCMIRLYDAATGAPLQVRGEASGITWAAHWDEHGLIVSTEGGEVILLDPSDLESSLAASRQVVHDVDPCSGRRIVSCRGEAEVRLIDSSGSVLARLESDPGHPPRWLVVPASDALSPAVFCVHPDRLVAYSGDGVALGSVQLPGGIGWLGAVSPGGADMIWIVGMSAVRISGIDRALRDGTPVTIEPFKVEGRISDWFCGLSRDRDGRPVLCRMDATVFEWPAGSGPRIAVSGKGWIQDAVHLSDGGWVLGNHNGCVQRVLGGATVWTRDLRRAYVRSIACCEASGRCYVLMANGPVHVLRLDSGEPLCMLGKIEGGRRIVAPSAAGGRLEVIRMDGSVREWRPG